MKYLIWFSLFFIVFSSCQSLEQPDKPEVIIDEDQMVTILYEIAKVKAAKSSFKKKLEDSKFNPEAYILEKYKIDSLTFSKNNAWYASDFKRYEELFKRVKDTIDKYKVAVELVKKKEDSIQKIQDSILKVEKKIKDSIAKIPVVK
ncbi:DUF4296 domain-containing protein [Aquimarina sp. ERC-38]|uniref:DUF4296 domain-containing protein n=1 Tax=Aquimarina sp. ERC-38 TaxID=2949996 RepID=UPI002246D0EC|nr:DUF4296 domain-containing protein [Aquimarina sp. ERC-38]UZO82027.1 DUF4296 domain-containing protein [Aquimarina sp. ERC-38]